MPQIVPQRDGLHQVRVQAQGAGDGGPDLGHLQGVGEAGAVVIPFVDHEHLGLVLQPPERLGVDDAVPIPLELGTQLVWFHRVVPPPGAERAHRIRGQVPVFPSLQLLPDRHHVPRWNLFIASRARRSSSSSMILRRLSTLVRPLARASSTLA